MIYKLPADFSVNVYRNAGLQAYDQQLTIYRQTVPTWCGSINRYMCIAYIFQEGPPYQGNVTCSFYIAFHAVYIFMLYVRSIKYLSWKVLALYYPYTTKKSIS